MLNRYDLACFDMDGTLTKARSSWIWVHDYLGTSNEEGYKRFVNQEITEEEFMREDIGIWRSVKPDLSKRDIIHMFQSIPLINGIQETVATLHECGIRCVIISGGIDICCTMLANEFGFDDFAADELITDNEGHLTGEGVKVVDLADKGHWVKVMMEKYGTTPERTIAIGNSFSDVSMFNIAGLSIAFNPTDPWTSEAADHTVKSETISDILDCILHPEE
ncbi:MAG: HAD-IB family phosphatase [archaeon]|nr:HAD-IB family phosphatase [archaeon]